MADLKISQFTDGGAIQSTDEIATNRAGINTKVFVGSAAAMDVGAGVGDIIAWQDDGGGNPQYPSGNGSQITDVETSADLVSYIPSSGSSIISDNVQDAIDELETEIFNLGGVVNVTVDDTTPSVLDNKITVGTGILKTINNPGGDEDLELEVDFTEVATAAQGALAGTALQPDENVITANTGSSYNMDFANAQNFVLTMTANCTLNITNPPTEGGKVALKLIQDSTPRTPTFSMGGLSWAGGSAPTIPAGSGDYVWLVFVTANGGTSWDGFLSGTFE